MQRWQYMIFKWVILFTWKSFVRNFDGRTQAYAYGDIWVWLSKQFKVISSFWLLGVYYEVQSIRFTLASCHKKIWSFRLKARLRLLFRQKTQLLRQATSIQVVHLAVPQFWDRRTIWSSWDNFMVKSFYPDPWRTKVVKQLTTENWRKIEGNKWMTKLFTTFVKFSTLLGFSGTSKVKTSTSGNEKKEKRFASVKSENGKFGEKKCHPVSEKGKTHGWQRDSNPLHVG